MTRAPHSPPQALQSILTINGGSSTIRFAVYDVGRKLQRRLDGKIDRVGVNGTTLLVSDPAGTPPVPHSVGSAGHRSAVGFLRETWIPACPTTWRARNG